MRGRPSRRPFSLITAIDFPCLRKRTVALGNDPPGLNQRPRSRTLKLNLLPIGVAHSKPGRAINRKLCISWKSSRDVLCEAVGRQNGNSCQGTLMALSALRGLRRRADVPTQLGIDRPPSCAGLVYRRQVRNFHPPERKQVPSTRPSG